MYETIITHDDMDGVVSAALCSYVHNVNQIRFGGPSTIANAQIPITKNDIVCDLPFPLECGLWFDHHEGNHDELIYRKIDLSTIDGKFELESSCARVIYNFYKPDCSFPEYFERLVEETDIIDSFNYASIEEWREETPGKIIEATTKLRDISRKERHQYLRNLVFCLRDNPIEEVVRRDDVLALYKTFQKNEQQIINHIGQASYFAESDTNKEIVIIDLTIYNKPVFVVKNLSYLLYPEAYAVLEIANMFNKGIKSNNLNFSMSLSINLNDKKHSKDVGDIMRDLNIGDGHKGAAAGKIFITSKKEMLASKKQTIEKIIALWNRQ